MPRLRFWLLVLIGYLFLLFNIERINEGINIASFVYVLVTVAAGTTLLLWRFARKLHPAFIYVPMYVLYFALKVLLDYPIAGANLPITITEILTLLMTILIVRQISYGMWDFEETIQNLTFRQIGLPPRLYESIETEELYRELKRSRRLNHPLTVVVMKPDFDPVKVPVTRILLDLQKTMASRYVQARLAKILSETLHDYDLVAINGEEFVILLPEAERADAEGVIARIHQDALQQMDIPLRFGVAQFPGGGVTLAGLVRTAAEDMRFHARSAPAPDRQFLGSAPALEDISGRAHQPG